MDAILAEVKKINILNRTPVKSYQDAVSKLIKHGMTEEQIATLVRAFAGASDLDGVTALADYEILHGLPYLDDVLRGQSEYDLTSEMVATLFQMADICLYNLEKVLANMTRDIDAENIGAATVKMHWCVSFHDTLGDIARLMTVSAIHGEQGNTISIEDSPAYQSYLKSRQLLHTKLMTAIPETEENIAQEDLDVSRRFIFFSEFINCNYATAWQQSMSHVRMPNKVRHENETGAEFYSRITSVDRIKDAVYALDLSADTPFTQFRAYHQISELCSRILNKWVCRGVELVMQQDGTDGLRRVLDLFRYCDSLFFIVQSTLKPIIRSLSPKSYSTIRAGVGIISGAHSISLRKGLFTTVYPLLVRAYRLRMADFDPAAAADDAFIEKRAAQIMADAQHWEEAKALEYLISFHHRIRGWRDDHMQLIKTQIGVSPEDEAPTASVAGSKNAIQAAGNFRAYHNKGDPIRPIFKSGLGRDIPPALPIYAQGGFDEYMSHLTARAVKTKMYVDLQNRVHNRVPGRNTAVAKS